MIGRLGEQGLGRCFPGGDGDRGRGMRRAAADVEDRVAEDHHIASPEAMAAEFFSACNGDWRQFVTMRRVAAEGAEWEIVIQAGFAKLHPGPRFDVPSEEAEDDARFAAERVEQRANSGELAHARRCMTRERVDVARPQPRHSLIDLLFAPSGIAQHHVRDLRIGPSGEVILAKIAAETVDLRKSGGIGLPRRATIGDQCAIDVEENQFHDTAYHSAPMAILKVARLGHPVLREKASDLEIKDIKAGKFRPLIDDMIETMHAYEGVGLAGPQVHLPLRIFVFEVEEAVAKRRGIPKLGAGVFFNATYEPIGGETITDWEGCLSVPFLGGEVPRFKRVKVRGIDHQGNPADIEVDNFPARIFQHEIDHTEGHVYLDRMPDLTTLGYTVIL